MERRDPLEFVEFHFSLTKYYKYSCFCCFWCSVPSYWSLNGDGAQCRGCVNDLLHKQEWPERRWVQQCSLSRDRTIPSAGKDSQLGRLINASQKTPILDTAVPLIDTECFMHGRTQPYRHRARHAESQDHRSSFHQAWRDNDFMVMTISVCLSWNGVRVWYSTSGIYSN